MITTELKNIIKHETSIDLNNKETLLCRDRDFIEARAIYYKLLRKYTNMTYTKIGRSVSKNHATILHACNNFDWWLKQDEGLLNVYTKVKEKFSDYLGYEKVDKKLEYNLERLFENYIDLKKQYEILKEHVKEINK
jgi:uncharacterized protein YdaL